MSGQSSMGTNLLPDLYGSLEFGFKSIVFFFRKSMRILFTDRALPTIRLMDKILEKLSPSPYSPKYGSLRGVMRLFRCPDSALPWGRG